MMVSAGLNVLLQVQTAAETAGVNPVGPDFIDEALSRSLRRFDKGGEAFYDQISALHKAVRGSAPDAALYWLAKMIYAGEDPRFILRRMIIFASEDIGNADRM